jgi:integrase
MTAFDDGCTRVIAKCMENPLYRVQRLLGHSTPVMTARYSKLADADLKEAVETMERAAEIKKGGKVIRLRKKA